MCSVTVTFESRIIPRSLADLRNTIPQQVRDPGKSDANMSGYPVQNLKDIFSGHSRTIQYY